MLKPNRNKKNSPTIQITNASIVRSIDENHLKNIKGGTFDGKGGDA